MIKALSYVGFTSPNAEQWRSFAPDILGLELASGPDDEAVLLRMDDAAWRISIAPGERDDLEFVGWDVGDGEAFEAAVARVQAHDIEVHHGDASLAAARGVDGVAWFIDPIGFRHELSTGQRSAATEFDSPAGVEGFVTGDQGLGHIVMLVPDLEAATEFFVGLLGFRHSDDIEAGMKIRFFHCNPRHHTLAISQLPGHRGVHHVMLEATNVDDVGLAYDRAVEAGQPIAMTLGRHPNDLMTSFYVRTPSGFEIEFGAGGRHMNMQTPEQPGFFNQTSIWGHKPPAEPLFPGVLRPIEPSV